MSMTAPSDLSPALVIGTGLIGTSIALGLKEAGADVYLRDSNPENVRLAQEIGAGSGEPVIDPKLVVVAVPPSAVLDEVLAALKEFDQAIVTDVASVKTFACEAIDDARYIGGHPMAGKERSGPLAASGRLFEGRPWAIVPARASNQRSLAVVELLALTLGAVPVKLDAEQHDQAVALVSHVPHLLSNLTAGLLNDADREQMALSGQGLRDVTRIARSDAGLWVDIIRANAAPVSAQLHELRARLDDVIAIVDGDVSALDTVLARGRAGTQRIPGKHGDVPTDLTTVYVTIDDVAGELARLLTETGDSGVNIEDLRIDHEVGRPVGLVEIHVLPERASFLAEALNNRGWSAYL